MIDWARVNSLRNEIGEDSFDEVVELFLDEVETVISRLRSHPDPATYEQDLHFLKGSAWNLGFADFGAVCQDGERLAAHGDAGAIDIGAVVESYVQSRKSFMAGIAGRSSAA
jgi:HPt (histidine-containing phosphotransfer) domain-containing protein